MPLHLMDKLFFEGYSVMIIKKKKAEISRLLITYHLTSVLISVAKYLGCRLLFAATQLKYVSLTTEMEHFCGLVVADLCLDIDIIEQ